MNNFMDCCLIAMASILPQNTLSLRKEIFDYLSSQIEKGALIPGSLINVRKLTVELNVSRTPLREALAQLEIQGLVSILPQRGVRINVLMSEDLLDLFEIIGALESQVVLTVFHRITDKEIHRMDHYNRAMERAIQQSKNRTFHEINVLFHRVFLDLSANRELTSYVGSLKLRLFGFALKSYHKGADLISNQVLQTYSVCQKLATTLMPAREAAETMPTTAQESSRPGHRPAIATPTGHGRSRNRSTP